MTEIKAPLSRPCFTTFLHFVRAIRYIRLVGIVGDCQKFKSITVFL